jgi:tetratricopeptide (TPR) repeat protein
MIVNIDDQGHYSVGGHNVTLEQLASRIASEGKFALHIRAEKGAPIKKIVDVFDVAKTNNVPSVNLEAASRDSRQAAAREFYERAMKHYMANEYEEELVDLNQALELDSSHTSALFSRASLYYGGLPMDKRDYSKAVEDYTRLLELEPRNCSARHNRALCYEQLRQPDKALADYTRILEGDTDFSRLVDGKEKQMALDYHYRGRVYQWNRKDYAKAVADYTEALRLDPDIAKAEAGGRIVLRRGQAYQALKQDAKAQADYERYQEIDPTYGELWVCWAWQLATASDARYRDGAKAIEFAGKEIAIWRFWLPPAPSTASSQRQSRPRKKP